MSYMQCHKCGEAVGEPTAREILNDDWACPQCGHSFEVSDDMTGEAICQILENVEGLESTVNDLSLTVEWLRDRLYTLDGEEG